MVLIKSGTHTILSRPHQDSGMWVQKGFQGFGQRKKKDKSARRKFKKRIPYALYMKSKLWRNRRARYFKTHPKRCVVCRDNSGIELHHLVYSQQGNEPDAHLAAACKSHHQDFHDKYGISSNMLIEWQLYLNDCKS